MEIERLYDQIMGKNQIILELQHKLGGRKQQASIKVQAEAEGEGEHGVGDVEDVDKMDVEDVEGGLQDHLEERIKDDEEQGNFNEKSIQIVDADQ